MSLIEQTGHQQSYSTTSATTQTETKERELPKIPPFLMEKIFSFAGDSNVSAVCREWKAIKRFSQSYDEKPQTDFPIEDETGKRTIEQVSVTPMEEETQDMFSPPQSIQKIDETDSVYEIQEPTQADELM